MTTPNWIYESIHLDIENYSFEYLEILHQMYGVIHLNARKRAHLTVWNVHVEVKYK